MAHLSHQSTTAGAPRRREGSSHAPPGGHVPDGRTGPTPNVPRAPGRSPTRSTTSGRPSEGPSPRGTSSGDQWLPRSYEGKETPDLAEPLILALLLLTGWKTEPPPEGTDFVQHPWRAWKGHSFASIDLLVDLGFVMSPRKTKTLFLTDAGLERARQVVDTLKPLGLESLVA